MKVTFFPAPRNLLNRQETARTQEARDTWQGLTNGEGKNSQVPRVSRRVNASTAGRLGGTWGLKEFSRLVEVGGGGNDRWRLTQVKGGS